jgi:poly(A) polymerase
VTTTAQHYLAQLAEATSSLPDAARELGELFEAQGHELALVGGPVRDAILGRPCHDLDFATSATPDETEAILREWGSALWTMGKAYGTIGAQRGGDQVEITTYRSDQYDPQSRKPVVAFGDTLDGDLSRRDFTVNAMAIRVPSGTFVDPFDGLSDLSKKLLRTPIEPEKSFDDDPRRMMRAARFASQLGFAVQIDAAAAMYDMAHRISIVSVERVQAELTALLLGEHPRAGLEILVDSGLADEVLPELPALALEVDEHHRHKDVYEHSLIVLDQAIEQETGPDGPVPGPDLVIRLAALLHDCGKPATRRFLPGGKVSFYNHDLVGARLVTKRLTALKYDKHLVKDVARLVELHLRFHGYGEAQWTDAAVRRYVTDAGPLLARLHILTRADCTTRNRRKAEYLRAAYADLVERIDELREREEIEAIRPDLDGTQIMEILGISPGRDVGRAYRYMLALRMDQGPLPQDEAVAALTAWWAEESAQRG